MVYFFSYFRITVKMVMGSLLYLFELLVYCNDQFFKLFSYTFAAVNAMLIGMKLVVNISPKLLEALMMAGQRSECIKELVHWLPQFQALFGPHASEPLCIDLVIFGFKADGL